MSHDKSPIEQVLDLAVFGPLGLALSARESLPEWIDKGRGTLVHQVAVARMVGEQAARFGQKKATDALVGFGILPGPPPPPRRPGPSGAAGSATEDGPKVGASDFRPGSGEPTSNGSLIPSADAARVGQPVPGPTQLAIPGYDSLSASQVVQRLAGLATGELEAVRTYETAGRGRRTILTKISQLQTGRS